ncbi:MAG: BatD family protein, partial [Notoacmeibacter sp.]|nr:BatD family protein [Notoacmeibacter sp.]
MVMRPALLALSLFLLVLAGPGLARAATISSPSISLRLESDRIVSGDTVVLEIESVGLDAPIDLGPLRDIAAIGRETYGTRIAVIEGKVVEVKLRRIEIVPRETGLVIVGPLSAGAVSSNSQSVTVLAEPPPDWSPGPDDLQLVMRVSKADPHVQEEVILDIELAHRHPLVADEMPVPDLSGLDAVPVHEERRTLDEKAGLRRIAWRYLVWPRRSGALVIPG